MVITGKNLQRTLLATHLLLNDHHGQAFANTLLAAQVLLSN